MESSFWFLSEFSDECSSPGTTEYQIYLNPSQRSGTGKVNANVFPDLALQKKKKFGFFFLSAKTTTKLGENLTLLHK